MKKVLYIITKSNWGGAQRYVFDLATAVRSTGFEPVVAFGPAAGSDKPGLLARKLADAGVRTLFVPGLGRDIGFADISALATVYRLLKRESPDVVHLNSSKVGILGAISARAAGIPRIIFTAHGWPFREDRSMPWRITAWLGSFLTVCLSHRVICVSDADRRAFMRMPLISRKIVLIYNGITLPLRLGTGERIRTSFPPHTRITGTIGELTANKNHTALIDAARADPSLHVAIVGEGEDRPELERRVAQYGLQDRVRLFGFVPAEDALPGFDTFVLPSLKEGLPYVVIEAKAAGLPIDARRTGGVGEILDLPIETFSLERMVRDTINSYDA